MKKHFIINIITICFGIELAVLFFFAAQNGGRRQDAVAVNEALHMVQEDWGRMGNHRNPTALDYVVVDMEGAVLFRTKSGLSESVNQAVIHRDTILDLYDGGSPVGKLLIFNDTEEALLSGRRRAFIWLGILMAAQMCTCIWYSGYLERSIIRPFRKMKDFARRVAEGNLDIPLEMDRHNLFGAFTESFDIMRAELKKARRAEAEANAAKKELVAKLSHDIKTPVASIQAAAEVGAALAERAMGVYPEAGNLPEVCPGQEGTGEGHRDEEPCRGSSGQVGKVHTGSEAGAGEGIGRGASGRHGELGRIRENYLRIMRKAEQINALVTNLFTATLEELEQLAVTPGDMEGRELEALLKDADYLGRGNAAAIPACLLYADRLRLQQVFDNIFVNSYKYAGTPIQVAVQREGRYLAVSIEDSGGGVSRDELPLLKEKFRRGSNAAETEGAGLGLYISDYFMKEMHGDILVENGERGLRATVLILLSGVV